MSLDFLVLRSSASPERHAIFLVVLKVKQSRGWAKLPPNKCLYWGNSTFVEGRRTLCLLVCFFLFCFIQGFGILGLVQVASHDWMGSASCA